MKKRLRLMLQLLGGLFAILLLVLAGLAVAVNTPAVRKRVLSRATEILSGKLGTKATIDSLHVSLAHQNLELYGVGIDDQQQRKLFEMDRMVVDFNLTQLLANEIEVKQARIKGLRAHVVDHPGEAPNYQSILDALKREKAPGDTTAMRQKTSRLKFDLRDVKLEQVKLTYNDIDLNIETVGADLDGSFRGRGTIKDVTLTYEDNLIHLGRLEVQFTDKPSGRAGGGERWKETGVVEDLRTHWTSPTKNGPVETTLEIGKLEIRPEGQVGKLRLSRLHYTTDNHQPRKNAGRPKRGAFDTGHFNVWADLEADLLTVNKDSVFANITNCTVSDTLTGIFLRELKAQLDYQKGVAHVRHLTFSHLGTKVSVDSAAMQLPSRKKGLPLTYHTGTVTVHTQLKDIAVPFAPVLKNFRMPLLLTTTVTGNDNGMTFNKVHVSTADRQLDIKARGGISDLKDKHKMTVRFDVDRMHTHSTKVMEIINQFAVKKLMTDQLRSLNTIDYAGQVGIYWKNERFSGKLKTQDGDIDFKISLDETNKYIDGNIDTKSFDVGKAFRVKSLSRLAFSGDFKVDFSTERTARMRRDKSGKLPIGTAQILVKEVVVSKIRYTDIFADVSSDGATALLNVDKPGRVANLGFDVSYTSTTAGNKVKVKPKLHFNVFKNKNK